MESINNAKSTPFVKCDRTDVCRSELPELFLVCQQECGTPEISCRCMLSLRSSVRSLILTRTFDWRDVPFRVGVVFSGRKLLYPLRSELEEKISKLGIA